MSNDELVEAVWAGHEPAGAMKRLQVAVARLRRTLEQATGDRRLLRSVAGGYLLSIDEGDVDADPFAVRVAEGRVTLDGGQPRRAAELLREALELWRGPAFADVAYEDFAHAEIRSLDELRVAAFGAAGRRRSAAGTPRRAHRRARGRSRAAARA